MLVAHLIDVLQQTWSSFIVEARNPVKDAHLRVGTFIVEDPRAHHCFLDLATLRGTMLSADMELIMLSKSLFAGMTGAP